MRGGHAGDTTLTAVAGEGVSALPPVRRIRRPRSDYGLSVLRLVVSDLAFYARQVTLVRILPGKFLLTRRLRTGRRKDT